MEIGKVYKNKVDNTILRAIIYIGGVQLLAMNVNQDNTQEIEFTLDTSAEWAEAVSTFDNMWEEVEGLTVIDQVKAYMGPMYA